MDSEGDSNNGKNEDKIQNIKLNQVKKKEDSSNKSKIVTPNANGLAIYIIKSSKILFEKYFSEKAEEENEKLFEGFKERQFSKQKEFRDFNLDLFDEPLKYYNDLKNYLDFQLEYLCYPNNNRYQEVRSLIKSNVSLYYFSILLDLLLDILEKNPDAHKDNIIKFDITMICELFHEKNKRLFSSHSFFYCCVNELKEKYEIDNLPDKNTFRKNYFTICKNKASTTLEKVKKNLDKYIKSNLDNYSKILYKEWKDKKYSIKNDVDAKECEIYKKNIKKFKC